MSTNRSIYFLFARKFEDTKEVSRSRKSREDRQCNGQRKKPTRQSMIYKTPHKKATDRATGTPLNIDGKLKCPRRLISSYSTGDTLRVTVKLVLVMNIVDIQQQYMDNNETFCIIWLVDMCSVTALFAH